jgi:hypothetical protein
MAQNLTEDPKVKVMPLVGTCEQVYPALLELRKTKKILEEIISLTPFEKPAPKLQGLHQLNPEMGIMMTCLITFEEKEA